MVNRSGRTGRDGEHTAVAYLAAAGFDVEREGKRAPSLDVIGNDLSTPVEVKRRATISFPAWTRKVADKHGDKWALFIIQRDKRKGLHPDTMTVPAEFGAYLLRLYEHGKETE